MRWAEVGGGRGRGGVGWRLGQPGSRLLVFPLLGAREGRGGGRGGDQENTMGSHGQPMKIEPNTPPSALRRPDLHTYTFAFACPYTQSYLIVIISVVSSRGRGAVPQIYKVLCLSHNRTVLLCAAPSSPLHDKTPHQSCIPQGWPSCVLWGRVGLVPQSAPQIQTVLLPPPTPRTNAETHASLTRVVFRGAGVA